MKAGRAQSGPCLGECRERWRDRFWRNQEKDSYHWDPHPEQVDLGRPLREDGLCPAGAKSNGQDQWAGKVSPRKAKSSINPVFPMAKPWLPAPVWGPY